MSDDDIHSSHSSSDEESVSKLPKIRINDSDRDNRPSESRVGILERIKNLEFYGVYDREFLSDLSEIFEQHQVFSPSVRESRDPRPKDDSIRKALLDPPCFEQFKVPKVLGLASKRTQAFEKPLFDRASSIRNTLVPLSAALILLKTDPQTAEMILTELLKDLIKEFQKVNYDRVIAVTPDPDVRKALSLPGSHALRDEDVLDDLKAAKKLAKTFEPKKPGKHRRGNRSQSERSSASRSSSSRSDSHPAAQLDLSSSNLAPSSQPASSSNSSSSSTRGTSTRGGRPSRGKKD